MQQYVIAPINNLDLMEKGDRIFALAHLWLKYEEYRSFIKQKKEDGWFVTLDNSAAERSLVTEDALIEICHELKPQEVIAPDVLFDCQATIDNCLSFINRMHKEGLFGEINIFFCPQGKSREEWLEAYMFGLDNPDIDVIGLSKIAVPKAWMDQDNDQCISEARNLCYDYLKENDLLRTPIHCLGQGDPREFAHYDHEMMRSSDSVFPVFAAHLGQSFDKEQFDRVPTPHDYLETGNLNDQEVSLAEQNIIFVKNQMA